MDNIENVSFEPAPEEKYPRCPHCREELRTIWLKTKGIGWAGQKEIWMCPYCECFLVYNAWKR